MTFNDIHYITAGNGLCAMVVKQGTTVTPYFTYTDHLGSILTVTDISGAVAAQQNFDAWGRNRNPTNWTYASVPAVPDWLYRGFTGHEHLVQFALVNMNGRMYDPANGRMLSPDNYVQFPFFSQSYNRYLYVANNPLTFTDPSGNFIVADSWLKGFFSGLFSGGLKSAWHEANNRAGNDAKIWGGLFATDPNKSFFGRLWEQVSRFTYQLPQEVAGFAFSQVRNTMLGDVERVDYRFGATVLQGRNDHVIFNNTNGVTLGNFINGSNQIRPNANNPLFQHEYGHYIQSQAVGPMFLGKYGIPGGWFSHEPSNLHPGEQDANARAFRYFNNNIDGYNNTNWHFEDNPIDNYNPDLPFDNAANQQALRDAIIRPQWFDYFYIPVIYTIVGSIVPGIVNAFILNRQY